jgi:hypothetical protein
LPAFGASTAGRAGTFAAGFAPAFFSGLRAVDAGFADGFDFAAIFFDFATALAMFFQYVLWGENLRALHHFGVTGARRGTGFPALHM